MVTITKTEIEWHYMHYYLNNIHFIDRLKRDKVFWNLLCELEKYVDSKIEPKYNSDISDIYVVIEQSE